VLCVSAHRDRVRLTDISALTFARGTWTTGRRSAPVQQLACTGGSAGCREIPSSVLCRNAGFDGRDVQWKCEANLPSDVKLGRIQVNCEGFDYPEDPFILAGSCGLEFELDRDYSSSYRDSRYYAKPTSVSSTSWIPTLIFWGVLLTLLYLCCAPGSQRVRDGGFNGRDDDYRGPPPYPGHGPSTSSYPSAPAPSGSGFWTGAGVGGALGYMAGRRSQRYSGWGSSGYFGGASRTPTSSSSSTRTSSSYGGTKRR